MQEIIEKYKLPLLLGGVSVISIFLSIVLLVKSTQTTTSIEFSTDTASVSATLIVDIEGAVQNPGVYTLPAGSRVEDAITAAGGLTEKADTELFAKTMNRAAKLVDGGKIYIPQLGSGLLKRPDPSLMISVNFANQSELESLPGVGPVTAKKIMDNRPYQTLDELVAKKAVGTALFEKIKEKLSL